jgi:hypothetical protein
MINDSSCQKGERSPFRLSREEDDGTSVKNSTPSNGAPVPRPDDKMTS